MILPGKLKPCVFIFSLLSERCVEVSGQRNLEQFNVIGRIRRPGPQSVHEISVLNYVFKNMMLRHGFYTSYSFWQLLTPVTLPDHIA